MPSIGPRPRTSWASIGLLVVASPLLLAVAWFVLVDWPWDVAIGFAAVFSGHDVVQTADAEETGVSLLLLLIVVAAVCWLLRVRLLERFALYGLLLVVPIIALLGLATEYGLQALLAARGYRYCTYHVISTDRGGNGTYVYTRDDRPDLCAATKLIFPPRRKVPGRRAPFDLPAE
ncbi:MAG: hypothetical protein ACRYF2_08695 [Janthinobacterium lividum]